MSVQLNPYINFRNNAREALEFYHGVFGGNLNVGTYKEMNAAQDPAEENLIMHGQLEAPNGLTLMAADTPPRMELQPGNNIQISLSGDDESTLRSYWDGLSEGGQITMPLQKAVWGDTFGMCIDRFGIAWLVNIAGAR